MTASTIVYDFSIFFCRYGSRFRHAYLTVLLHYLTVNKIPCFREVAKLRRVYAEGEVQRVDGLIFPPSFRGF